MAFKFNPFTKKLDYYPKLDDCAVPDDNTDLNASTTRHGLLLKLDNDTGKWLRSDGAWQAIPELDTLTDNSMADTLHRHSELSASDGTPDQALIVDAAGNVGIGTTSPDSIFHIKANTPGTVGSHPAGQLIIQDPDDTVFGNAVITGYESDGAGNPDQQLWYLGSSSVSNTDIIFLNRRSANLHLGTNGVSRLTISGNGNVGIGEAVPAAKLDVNGDLILQNGTSINEFSTNGTLAGDSDDAAPTEKAVKTYVDGHVPAAHTHDTDTLQLDGINSDGGAFAFTTSGAITFNQDLIVDGGEIGITADPDLLSMANGALTVNGTLTATGIITGATNSRFGDTDIHSSNIEINTHGSGNRNAYIDFHGDDTYADYGLRIIRSNTGANAVSNIQHRGTGALSVTTIEAANLVFKTDNATRMTIAAGGDVTMTNDLRVDGGQIGITADPDLISMASGALTVNGTIAAATESTIGNTEIRDDRIEVNVNGSGNRAAFIDFVGDDTYADYGLRLIRWNTGVNANSSLEHRGTGTFSIITDEAGPISFNTDSTIRLTIGATGAIAIASGATLGFAVGTTINEFSIDDTLGGDSDDAVPTEQAVKAYVDGQPYAKIYTGTYTGNGSTSYAITGVGFTPKFVEIWHHPVSEIAAEVFEKLDQTWTTYAAHHFSGAATQHKMRLNAVIALGADGFTVDDAGGDLHPNKNNQVYDFICFG